MIRYDRVKFYVGLDCEAYEVHNDETPGEPTVINLDGTPLDVPTEHAYCLVTLGEKTE